MICFVFTGDAGVMPLLGACRGGFSYKSVFFLQLLQPLARGYSLINAQSSTEGLIHCLAPWAEWRGCSGLWMELC